jgi:uncharacterized sulfatase
MQPVLDFLDDAAKQGRPFFVWYAPMLPHSPHNAPERLLVRYREHAPSLEVAQYWAMCEWFDETCGQLLGHLDAKGLADDTLVVFLADNGWIQDPAADRYAPRSKQSPYDGGLRTPILVRWKGRVRPSVSESLASSLDIAPSILAAVGLDPTPEMPGINLLDEAAARSRPAIFGEVFTHNAVDLDRPASGLRFRWVIEGDRKLIVPSPRHEPAAPVELFDLARDPSETTNLAGREPARVAALRSKLDDWWPGE